MIELFHAVAFFLGQPPGELFKTTIELLLFSFLNYMIISEFTRNRKPEYRFLIIAFTAMACQKLVSVVFLSYAVFIDTRVWIGWISFMDNFLELFSLFIVASSLVYPIIKQKKLDTVKFMKNKIFLIIPLSFILTMFVVTIIELRGGSMSDFFTNSAINVTEIVILVYFSAYLLTNTKFRLRYRTNIVLAFILYSITPMIELFNIVLYNNMNRSLTVASQPFPFLSVAIITQVIYLKVVDKATIIDRLRKSEKKYLQEKEVSKLKDEFISTVSHELRTPLTSMKLYVSLLKDKKLGKVSKKQANALGIIHQETNRLNQLIADILDLSRLEAQKVRPKFVTFNLHEIVSNELYLNMAKNQGINVVINVPKNFMILADKDKIQQAFINIFTNSTKFTPDGGTITISAWSLKADWLFSIGDTGKGVPRNMIPKLFDKFYQVENIMTRSQGGTGLGLAIVKNIVDLHKGKIWVESEVGRGTVVTMRIPRELIY